eukprot:1193039-Amphidinium_carterae.1
MSNHAGALAGPSLQIHSRSEAGMHASTFCKRKDSWTTVSTDYDAASSATISPFGSPRGGGSRVSAAVDPWESDLCVSAAQLRIKNTFYEVVIPNSAHVQQSRSLSLPSMRRGPCNDDEALLATHEVTEVTAYPPTPTPSHTAQGTDTGTSSVPAQSQRHAQLARPSQIGAPAATLPQVNEPPCGFSDGLVDA